MKQDWNQLFRLFQAKKRAEAIKQARRNLQQPEQSDWQWLTEALACDERKWFVAEIFQGYPVPKRLQAPLLRAAVHERNPSMNKKFIAPCIDSFWFRPVVQWLLDIVDNGTNAEKAGAIAALYWTQMPEECPPDRLATALAPGYIERWKCEPYDTMKDLWQRQRETYLKVFIANEDVSVRREVISFLKLDESLYPDPLKPLVKQAIEIARSHPDDYIRHRVEVQLGEEHLLRRIPERNS